MMMYEGLRKRNTFLINNIISNKSHTGGHLSVWQAEQRVLTTKQQSQNETPEGAVVIEFYNNII
jgi:hypothetical protein